LNSRLNIKLTSIAICIAIYFSNCSTSKHLEGNRHLLTKNTVTVDGQKVKNKEVFALIKQKPNKKILGFIPLYLNIYNLSSPQNKNHYFKKIGESPVILNQSLLNKSTSQINLYFKNNGFFDVKTTTEIHKKKHKAKVNYKVKPGNAYIISGVSVNQKETPLLNSKIERLLAQSNLTKGKSYQFEILEKERLRIAAKLQEQGYYQFNKEFIHFIADTNQTKKEVHLELVVNPVEKNKNNIISNENHKIGLINSVLVVINSIETETNTDTTVVNGIQFIHSHSSPPYNLKRLAEKILIKPGDLFNKETIDRSYLGLSELKNFKKITFEFPVVRANKGQDLLNVHINLIPGKKIAYTVELEASTNPELKEGLSGSASISHYNIFKGAEHLQLTYKGSKNINLNDASRIVDIKENRLAVSLSIPSLLSPLKRNRNHFKNSRTKTILSASISEQKRPEFTRNSISGNLTYQWNTKQNKEHKLALFNLSYVDFQGESANLDNISEYLIAKDYSSHLIPTSSYTLSINNQDVNKLKNHSFLRFHIESSGSVLRELASALEFETLDDQNGNTILQDDGSPTYTIRLGDKENIFTQYIKTSLDYRYYWKIDDKNTLAARAMGGVIYAYGNTKQAPFQKKFIAGGANDLRGWQAFKKPTGNLSENSDTLYTGGVKILASLEYRFNLIKKLKGAVFMDAGNIWEIKTNNNKYQSANFDWNEFLNQIAIDVGFGFRYDFKYFVLRTDLGFPIREPSAGNFGDWKSVNINNSQLNIGLGYPF
jgi:outer membrane protein assembly factor BamA